MHAIYQTGVALLSLLVVGDSFLTDDQLATEPRFTVTETTTVQLTTTSTSPPTTCTDRVSNCDVYLSACYGSSPLLKWAKYNCAKTCKLCASELNVSTNNDCTDRIDNCPSYGASVCTSLQYRTWTMGHCRRYCGFCDSCKIDNGNVYQPGETWQDDCFYNCTCIGQDHFNCTPRCETFQSIPSNCYYINSTADACCQDVVCKVDTPRGQILTPYKNGRICIDKLSNCGSFPEACAPEYSEWADEYCPLTCNRC